MRPPLKRPELTQEHLRELLHYDSSTGVFTWRVSVGNQKFGRQANSKDARGYVVVQIDGVPRKAHRLAWLYVYGAWPHGMIDHRNGCVADNRIDNLRLATHSENMQNQRKAHIRNTSGFMGVSWHKCSSKYVAKIWHNGKRKHLGLFISAEEAAEAYLCAKAKFHPFQTIVSQT